MDVTIKNLKISDFASEETICFQCTVCIDGKPRVIAKNNGRGGAHMYYPLPGSPDFPMFDGEVEDKITNLVYEADFRKKLKKLLKRCAFVVPGERRVCTVTGPNDAGARQWVQVNYPTAVVLNDLPLDEAAALVRKTES